MTPQPLGSRYLLEEPLGQGGMGVVWRGRDRETGESCAIKVLRPELAADSAAVARFVRERTALIRFRHPNVVTLREMIVEGDILALVMDLIQDGDLDGYRRQRGGTLPGGEALEVTAQICDALAAAHAAGIVHRDLKPANVLLDGGQVRLADFGIARIAGEASNTSTAVVGTISFMAPEVIRGEEPTAACDVYAAGITLYVLLTGAAPFSGQPAAVMHAHLSVAPVQPPGVPDRLWLLMSACLSKDPAARPPAALVARALRDPSVLSDPAVLREPTVHPGATGAPYGARPLTADAAVSGLTSPRYAAGMAGLSGSARSGVAYAPRSVPGTASAALADTILPGDFAPGVTSAGGGMFPGALAAEFDFAGSPSSGSPSSGSPSSSSPSPGAVPEAFLGPAADPGGDGAGTPRGGSRRGGHRGKRRGVPRAVLATAAAVVLVVTGVTATYLVMSGSPDSGSAGPESSPLLGAAVRSGAAPRSKTAGSASSPKASGSATAGTATPDAAASPLTDASAAAPVTATSGAAQKTSAASTPAAPAGNPEPTGPNLVNDGDFTGSDLSAWNNFVTNTVLVSSGPDGGNAAQMTGASSGINEEVTGLTPGTSYELTGWALSDSGGGTYIGAKGYDSSGGVSRATGSTTWSELSMTFTATATSTQVFCWQSAAGNGFCTDVSLRALS
jgi:serine/threonine-protein kinase